MRVAQDDPRAHPDQLVDEEEPALEHLLEDQDRAPGLRSHRQGDRRRVRGECRPDTGLDLRDLPAEVVLHNELLARRYVNRVVHHVDLDAELGEVREDRDEVLRLAALDRERAAGDRGVDVLARDPPFTAAQPLDAADGEDVRTDPVDLGAERPQEAAEVLDVRLAGRVADHGLAARKDGGHDRVLGAHHARLVEEELAAREALGAELVAPVDVDLGAELLERVDVRVEAPPSDHVASRRRERRAAVPREQRAGEQEGGADACGEAGVDLGLREPAGADADLVLSGPLGLGAEVCQDLDHRLDVADVRHVPQPHLLVGEQGRSEDRQRAVLVAGGAHGSGQRSAALDHEGLHQLG